MRNEEMLKQYAPWIVAVVLAFMLGRWTAGDSDPTAADGRAPNHEPVASAPLAPEQAARQPLAAAPDAGGSAAEKRDGLDLMDALSEVLSDLWHRQPVEVVDVVTHMMSDRELSSAVTSLTNLTEEDLEDIDDLRAFSSRLAGIAAEGLLTDLEDADYAHVERVEFFAPGSDTAQGTFTTTEIKIIAEYPTPDDSPSRILVKWIQEEPYELLQFRRRSINPNGDYTTTSARQIGGWREGAYRVQIFSLNEEVDLLAEGRFDILGNAGSPAQPTALNTRD